MKRIYLLIGILVVGLFSCQPKPTIKKQSQPLSEQALELTKSLPDTVLTSKGMKENEFQADLFQIDINTKLTSLLDGEWISQNGEIGFLNTTLETGEKVIFHDTIRSSMTGWGTITYNRAAKFYFTESGSHIYEFYIVGDNRLVLTQYDYRNDDLSMKEKPETNIIELNIDFINNDKVLLDFQGQTIELKRNTIE